MSLGLIASKKRVSFQFHREFFEVSLNETLSVYESLNNSLCFSYYYMILLPIADASARQKVISFASELCKFFSTCVKNY